MYLFRWLTSRTVRKAGELADVVNKILNHQRDRLSAEAVATVESGLRDFHALIRSGADSEAIKTGMASLEKAANEQLKPYPNAGLRENLVMFLEIAILIVGSRAFLVQPMVIPTGSAQPTLWGITSQDLRGQSAFQVPSFPMRLWERWIDGVSYYQITAKDDCTVVGVSRTSFTPGLRFKLPMLNCVEVRTDRGNHRIWFPPENHHQHLGFILTSRMGDIRPYGVKGGESIVKARVVTGDHLFVERVTYNFRRPHRGETIVFRSERHPGMTEDTHYIKRLVGLGGERIRIGDDRHTYINGRKLTTNDYGFSQVFAFDPAVPPQSDHYSGHVNGTVWQRTTGFPGPTYNFPDDQTEVTVRPGHLICFGDNTMNSGDSRIWGQSDFPQERVIGKSCFVFWPFTKRFGWGQK
jgi:signal peptidase I